MHEDALLRDLRRRIVDVAREEHATRVTRISIWIGTLAHLSETTLRARWPRTVEGTAAESARLEVEVSTDLGDPRATGIVLSRLDIAETPGDAPSWARNAPAGPMSPREVGDRAGGTERCA